jgi:hypothetical protein
MLGLLAPRPTDVKSSKVDDAKSNDVPNTEPFEPSKKSPVLLGSAAAAAGGGAGGGLGAGGGVGAGVNGGGIIGA